MQIWPLVQKNFIYIKRKPNASLTTFMVTILGVFILLTTSNITYNNNKQRHQSITSTNLTFPDARHKFPYFHDIAIVSTNHTVYNYIEYLLSHYTPEFTCTTPQCEICYNMEDGSAKFMAFNCTNPAKKEELDEKAVSVEFDQQKHCHVAVISFPSNGEYEITMLGKLYKDADADYEQVLTFKVKVAIEIPKQKKVVSKSPVNVVNRQTSIEKKRSLSEKYTREKKMSQSAIDFDKKMKQKCYDNKNRRNQNGRKQEDGRGYYKPRRGFCKMVYRHC
jgi:hypothetical protein